MGLADEKNEFVFIHNLSTEEQLEIRSAFLELFKNDKYYNYFRQIEIENLLNEPWFDQFLQTELNPHYAKWKLSDEIDMILVSNVARFYSEKYARERQEALSSPD